GGELLLHGIEDVHERAGVVLRIGVRMEACPHLPVSALDTLAVCSQIHAQHPEVAAGDDSEGLLSQRRGLGRRKRLSLATRAPPCALSRLALPCSLELERAAQAEEPKQAVSPSQSPPAMGEELSKRHGAIHLHCDLEVVGGKS